MDKSSYSSFYSSFLRTEDSSTEEREVAENSMSNRKRIKPTVSKVMKLYYVDIMYYM